MPVARNIFPCQNLISCFQDIFIVSILGGVINMLRKEKLREISKKLSANKNDFISAFRNNIFMYVDDKDITLKDISEAADIPFSTLNSFLYGDSKDIKLSTAVKLAHGLDISIDELVGAETISVQARDCFAKYRNLPQCDQYLVRWYISYIETLNRQNKGRNVSVMVLEYNEHGNMKITTNYRKIDVSKINEEYRHKIFFGITMPCENYMPKYSPYDILLVANDRKPKENETSLVRIGSNLVLLKRKVVNGEIKYYSIRDNKFRMEEKEIDQ